MAIKGQKYITHNKAKSLIKTRHGNTLHILPVEDYDQYYQSIKLTKTTK